jgi:hypothetical protein
MPIADDLTHHVPRFLVQSRQRTANKQPKGPTAVSSDQAPDLHLLGSEIGFEPTTSGLWGQRGTVQPCPAVRPTSQQSLT